MYLNRSIKNAMQLYMDILFIFPSGPLKVYYCHSNKTNQPEVYFWVNVLKRLKVEIFQILLMT